MENFFMKKRTALIRFVLKNDYFRLINHAITLILLAVTKKSHETERSFKFKEDT